MQTNKKNGQTKTNYMYVGIVLKKQQQICDTVPSWYTYMYMQIHEHSQANRVLCALIFKYMKSSLVVRSSLVVG